MNEIAKGVQELPKPKQCYIRFIEQLYASSDAVYYTQYLIVYDSLNNVSKLKISKSVAEALIANGMEYKRAY